MNNCPVCDNDYFVQKGDKWECYQCGELVE